MTDAHCQWASDAHLDPYWVSIQLPTGFLLSGNPVSIQLPTGFRSILLTLFLRSKSFRKSWKSATIKVKNLLKVCVFDTETQICFRFHKELTSVFLDIKKLQRCLKVHRVERLASSSVFYKVLASSSVFYKVYNLIGKMLFFRRQAHLFTISVLFHKENDFFKLFRLIVCFVLMKSNKNCQKSGWETRGQNNAHLPR